MKMKKINVTETIVADIQLHIVQNGSGGLVIFWGMYPHQGGEVEHFWEALLELVPEQKFLFSSISGGRLEPGFFHPGKHRRHLERKHLMDKVQGR